VQTRGVAFTSQVAPEVAQSVHVTPPEPHCVSRNPSWHVPAPSQHPSGQFAGLHTGGATTQVPAEQTSPIDVQSLHVFPPIPHAPAAAPPTQAPLALQHPLHVPGPHGCATHEPLSQNAPVVVQFAHALPPVPQAVFCPPSAHTPLWQHPVQVTGPHVASHDPFTHSELVPHAWHGLPARPHAAVVVPPKQVLPAQHPEQFDGPHDAPAWHEPPAHCVPAPHALQAFPPAPHAESFVPGRQRLPSQQPVGQLDALHAPSVWQTFAMHAAVVPQSWHGPPPEPHASPAPPPVHELPSQHPAHVCGPHSVGTVQLPPEHTCVEGQLWHAPPPPPHAEVAVPDWHRPLSSQHPVHVCGLQPVATQTPPLFGPAGAHCESLHAWQASPPVPQASRSVPTTHPSGPQHPEQLFGPQLIGAHAPPPPEAGTQLSPVEQTWHWAPRSPHASAVVPGRHSVLTQQPAHGPHVGGGVTQRPLSGSHFIPAGQRSHFGGAASQLPPAQPGTGPGPPSGPMTVTSSPTRPDRPHAPIIASATSATSADKATAARSTWRSIIKRTTLPGNEATNRTP
jgi:hypothetical protein